VIDVKDDKFWKWIYILRLLRYCDKNTPSMNKIFFLSHRTSVAIESEDFFKDKNLFGSLKSNSNLSKEGNLVFGEGVDDSDDEDVVCLNEPPI
jgi:hypothetical protein